MRFYWYWNEKIRIWGQLSLSFKSINEFLTNIFRIVLSNLYPRQTAWGGIFLPEPQENILFTFLCQFLIFVKYTFDVYSISTHFIKYWQVLLIGIMVKLNTGSRSTFEFPSPVNLSGCTVCTVPSSMDRTSQCNKVDAG